VPLEPDLIPSGLVTLAGRYFTHGAPSAVAARMDLRRRCRRSLISRT
jgi:hypothetical protein